MDETILEKNIKAQNMRFLLHMMFTLIIAVGVAFFSNEIILDKGWNKNYFLFAGVLYGVLFLCSFLQRKHLYAKSRTMIILTACFLVSALLLLLSDFYVDLPIWLLGGIVAAALVDRNIGLLYVYFFVFHAIYLQGSVINGLIFHFVIATIMCFFISKMKTVLSMLYMMALTACVVVTASVVNNHFSISADMMVDTLLVLCTYIGCIFVTMLLVLWFGESVDKLRADEDATPELDGYDYLSKMAQETAIKDAEIAAEIAATRDETEENAVEVIEEKKEEKEELPIFDYTPYCKLNFELMKQLREKNKSSYAQAVYLGKFAGEAGEAIGLDGKLLKAAGMYKRIGKLKEDDKESTIALVKEYEFPEPLVNLIAQLWESETVTKEAAVLKITERVSNYYITVQNSAKKNITIEKIVDTVLTKPLFQGEYNNTGLSVQDYALLRSVLVSLFTELRQQSERG